MILPDSMSKRDIARVERKGGIIIVECKNPAAARFADPPADAGMDAQSRAAMELFRWIASKDTAYSTNNGGAIQFFVRALINGGKPPSVEPVKRAKGTP